MDMKKRRDMQLAYIADEDVMEEQKRCRKNLQKLNFADQTNNDLIDRLDNILSGLKYEKRRYHIVSPADKNYQSDLDIQMEYWG